MRYSLGLNTSEGMQTVTFLFRRLQVHHLIGLNANTPVQESDSQGHNRTYFFLNNRNRTKFVKIPAMNSTLITHGGLFFFFQQKWSHFLRMKACCTFGDDAFDGLTKDVVQEKIDIADLVE